ncbi:IclR family transcriptional regulator [Pectobacterium cacticida]|uniref:HTH-type transcriptional repressor AllR n=1 Tax=Pectobacterium cacticida TaxID=69221 RepID=A0ABZ2G4P4_9GAMM|nr:IclR family transcriptional regulator [Pectobacterium cacticida]UYX05421.1 IclR family transcriptional regulator [Pectobacterium cacticida]
MKNFTIAAESEETVATSERVLMLLRLIAGSNRPLSANELMATSGLTKSTLYRLLASLRRWGFVLETEKLYAPGPACLQLSINFDTVNLLAQHAQQAMQTLCEETQETVAVSVAMQNEAICISMLEPRQALRCSFEKGRSLPLHRGATAKCLLAHLPSSHRQAVLTTAWPDGFTRAERLNELEHIVRQGYAVSDSEVDEGVWGVSVPLLTHEKRLLGVLSLMAPSLRAAHRQASLIQATRLAADQITHRFIQAEHPFIFNTNQRA